MSRCTKPPRWIASSPAAACSTIVDRVGPTGSGPPRRTRARRSSPVDEPHREEREAVGLAGGVDRDHVRVLDRRRGARLAQEPLADRVVLDQLGRDHLQRDDAVEIELAARGRRRPSRRDRRATRSGSRRRMRPGARSRCIGRVYPQLAEPTSTLQVKNGSRPRVGSWTCARARRRIRPWPPSARRSCSTATTTAAASCTSSAPEREQLTIGRRASCDARVAVGRLGLAPARGTPPDGQRTGCSATTASPTTARSSTASACAAGDGCATATSSRSARRRSSMYAPRALDHGGITRVAHASTDVTLTPAQRRVLTCSAGRCPRSAYAAPASNRQIADELVVSVDTVKGTLSALFELFGLSALPQNQKRADARGPRAPAASAVADPRERVVAEPRDPERLLVGDQRVGVDPDADRVLRGLQACRDRARARRWCCGWRRTRDLPPGANAWDRCRRRPGGPARGRARRGRSCPGPRGSPTRRGRRSSSKAAARQRRPVDGHGRARRMRASVFVSRLTTQMCPRPRAARRRPLARRAVAAEPALEVVAQHHAGLPDTRARPDPDAAASTARRCGWPGPGSASAPCRCGRRGEDGVVVPSSMATQTLSS